MFESSIAVAPSGARLVTLALPMLLSHVRQLPSRFAPRVRWRFPALRTFGERIWRVSYTEMLTPAQIDYMLSWMYAPETIARRDSRRASSGKPPSWKAKMVGFHSWHAGDGGTALTAE